MRINVPDRNIKYIEIRDRIGWKALRDSEDARTIRALASVKAMGSDVYQSIVSNRARITEATGIGVAAPDPSATFDVATLLYAAVIDSGVGPLSNDQIDDLPPEVIDPVIDAMWEQYGLRKAPETEDERKNGSTPSPATSTAEAEA